MIGEEPAAVPCPVGSGTGAPCPGRRRVGRRQGDDSFCGSRRDEVGSPAATTVVLARTADSARDSTGIRVGIAVAVALAGLVVIVVLSPRRAARVPSGRDADGYRRSGPGPDARRGSPDGRGPARSPGRG
jgi:hypothetical protein